MDTDKRDELESRIMAEEDGATRWEIFKALADQQRSKKHNFYFEEVSLTLLIYFCSYRRRGTPSLSILPVRDDVTGREPSRAEFDHRFHM